MKKKIIASILLLLLVSSVIFAEDHIDPIDEETLIDTRAIADCPVNGFHYADDLHTVTVRIYASPAMYWYKEMFIYQCIYCYTYLYTETRHDDFGNTGVYWETHKTPEVYQGVPVNFTVPTSTVQSWNVGAQDLLNLGWHCYFSHP